MQSPESPLSSDTLLNIHEVMAEAAADKRAEKEPETTQTFRTKKRVKDLEEQICARHGITPSDFHRKCSETLVKDYLPAGEKV
jgi:hypothetical protein